MAGEMKGLYGKYLIAKANGSQIDPDAYYFVLRLDTDPAARAAARLYAQETDNSALASELLEKLDGYTKVDRDG